MREVLKNPFSKEDIRQMFEMQLSKVPFEVEKNTADEKGTKWTVCVIGTSISEKHFDIWHDDFIVRFNSKFNQGGRGYAHNIIQNFDDFRAEIFKAFNLQEDVQLSLF